ncbi:MAG: hypothetical protein J0H69_04525 [Burkholderiales bacterium]|jgi:2'-5' RNA ligase|nr:hypothetical protein [Burkholderiales bacterium]
MRRPSDPPQLPAQQLLDLPPGPDEGSQRLLVCLRPPRRVQQLLEDYMSLCPDLPERGRTVGHRLHLTLLYCPALHTGQVAAIQHELRQVRFESLTLQDFLPAPWEHGVAALLPTTQGPLAALSRQVALAARRAGVKARPKAPGTAHVTVARHPAASPRRMPSLRMNWRCDAFEMVHSPAYPRPYETIARYPS